MYDILSKFSPNGPPDRVFIIAPTLPGYPKAKFLGVVVFRPVNASSPLARGHPNSPSEEAKVTF